MLSWTISNLAYLAIGVRFEPGAAQQVARWAPLVLPLIIAPLTTVPRVRLQNRLQTVNGQLRDEIARRTELQAQLEYQSRHDPLTGVLNRRGFFEAAEAVAGADVLLLLVDLDRFKDVNDTYGHAAGDAVLRAVAEELTCGGHGSAAVVGRLGGDEFAVLLPAGARTQAELVRCRLARLTVPLLDATVVVASASVGIAVMGAGQTLTESLARTDTAMYEAKRTARLSH